MSPNYSATVRGVILGNILYVNGLFSLFVLLDIAPSRAVPAAIEGTTHSVLSLYLVLGGIIGSVDVFVVLSPVVAPSGGGGW